MSGAFENYLPPEPGTIFASKYEIIRPLGKGGMGVVLEARHSRLGQAVAIKLLKPELLTDNESVMRFEREARAAAQLTSAHAARIFDVDTTPEGIPFMVMEYLEGRDLASILQEQSTLSVEEAVDWVVQACAAMAEAHALGIVHRDLKPSNLFLAENVATGPMVKVLDFGISKITVESEQQLTTTATVLGTPHYMSPEQVTASRVVDVRADIWALCVILYRALTKSFPFTGPNPTALAVSIATEKAIPIQTHNKPLPESLMNAIMKGLEKNPSDRHQSVHELAAAIEPLGSGRWHVPAASSLRIAGSRSFVSTKGESTDRSRSNSQSSSGARMGSTGPSVVGEAIPLETKSTWGGGAHREEAIVPTSGLKRMIAIPAAAISVLALVGSAAYLAGSKHPPAAAVAPVSDVVSTPRVVAAPTDVPVAAVQTQFAPSPVPSSPTENPQVAGTELPAARKPTGLPGPNTPRPAVGGPASAAVIRPAAPPHTAAPANPLHL